MKTVTRFAPSPTGNFHIGSARTALFNWLFAKNTKGNFLIRIEDTDKARSTKDSINKILDGLKWLNLDWDNEIIYQSQNQKRHKEVAEELQLKLNEANEIQENVQKEGPTMSDEDKVDAQKRLRSLSQDANFLNEKLNQMRAEVVDVIQREQGPKFQKVVTELMRAKGIKIVLHSNAVLGLDDGDDSLNITPDIIELLNQDSES